MADSWRSRPGAGTRSPERSALPGRTIQPASLMSARSPQTSSRTLARCPPRWPPRRTCLHRSTIFPEQTPTFLATDEGVFEPFHANGTVAHAGQPAGRILRRSESFAGGTRLCCRWILYGRRQPGKVRPGNCCLVVARPLKWSRTCPCAPLLGRCPAIPCDRVRLDARWSKSHTGRGFGNGKARDALLGA